LSIELGKDKILLCELKRKKKELILYHTEVIDTPEGSVSDGLIMELDAVAAAIRMALKSHKIKTKKVIFTINSTRVLCKREEIPYLRPNQIKGEIEANLTEYFAVQPEEYEAGFMLTSTARGKVENMSLIAYAMPKKFLERYYELGAMMGLHIVAVDYAANSLYQLMKLQVGRKSGVFCHIGSENTALCIMEEGRLLFQRVVSCGKMDIVNAIMEQRIIPETQAEEELKTGQFIHATLDGDEITELFRYLINHIERIMDYFLSANDKNGVDTIYLMGEGSQIPGVKELFANELGMTISRPEESKGIKTKSKEKISKKSFHQYMPAVGASLQSLEFERPKKEEEEVEKKRSSGFGLGLTVSIMVSAAMVLTPYFQNQRLHEELNSVNANIALIEDAQLLEEGYNNGVKKIQDMKGFYDKTQNPNGTISKFVERLETIQPSGIQIDWFSFVEGKASIGGTMQAKEEIASFVAALKQEKNLSGVEIKEISGQSFQIQFQFGAAEGAK